ncbi:6703_t:CDS:1, partial [Dentiscutata erythropus]
MSQQFFLTSSIELKDKKNSASNSYKRQYTEGENMELLDYYIPAYILAYVISKTLALKFILRIYFKAEATLLLALAFSSILKSYTFQAHFAKDDSELFYL